MVGTNRQAVGRRKPEDRYRPVADSYKPESWSSRSEPVRRRRLDLLPNTSGGPFWFAPPNEGPAVPRGGIRDRIAPKREPDKRESGISLRPIAHTKMHWLCWQ